MTNDLTQGSIVKNLTRFSIPYLIACFLQTFYGLADLFITGQFRGAASISAVSMGSQVMHMLTVMIVGLAMGVTVPIGHAVGAKDRRKAGMVTGSGIFLFFILSTVLTCALYFSVDGIVSILDTPPEAVEEARAYIRICAFGVPAILFFNLLSGVFRGLGNTRLPMIFVFCAGVVNIGLDYVFIGPMDMGAAGAAIATALAQTLSTVLAAAALFLRREEVGMTASDLRPDRNVLGEILGTGFPTAVQEGIIQISFLVMTMIANGRGVVIAAGVGIVEKIISFLFLIPTAMQSSVSVMAAQNAGAGKHDRARETLKTAILICLASAAVILLIVEPGAEKIVGLFTGDAEVVRLGAQYLRTYVADAAIAPVHFCFSGFFTAYGKAIYSFAHNVISALCVRIPGAWLASRLFPDSLYAMGAAPPAGSVVSVIICVAMFTRRRKIWYRDPAVPALSGHPLKENESDENRETASH